MTTPPSWPEAEKRIKHLQDQLFPYWVVSKYKVHRRSLRIIELLTSRPEGMTSEEICVELDAQMSTVHNYIGALQRFPFPVIRRELNGNRATRIRYYLARGALAAIEKLKWSM